MIVHTSAPDRYGLLKEFARENRRNATFAEYILWQHLRCNSLGHKFYRQHIIGDFIVDFLCHDDGVIIEVDGAYHSEPKTEENDQRRTEILESMGYHIIRFTNEEVLNDLDWVLAEIEKALE